MMKLEPPVNENYAGIVVQITAVNQLANCDNVVGVPVFGYQAIVSKDTQVGDIGVVFPAETQLSEEYVSQNNLYRHNELNVDPTQKGYLEDNRRVKAMKFRGHQSSALFMPLESLSQFTDVSELRVGDVFDKLSGHEICRKYLVKQPVSRVGKNVLVPKARRVDEKFLPEHFSTDQWLRNKDTIPDGTLAVVTVKLHGTSVRIANTVVTRKLSWLERIAKRLGVNVVDTGYDYVYGSRRTIKDPNDPDQNHFYNEDIWTREGQRLRGLLPKGFVVYGELIGWASNDAAIQKNYTYGLPQGTCELYVYRVAQVNPEGFVVDLSWDAVKEFCNNIGVKHVPEIARGVTGPHFDEAVRSLLDIKFSDQGFDSPPLDAGVVDEGVCIRVESIVPYILKAKSPLFFEHETKLLDEAAKTDEILDLEAAVDNE